MNYRSISDMNDSVLAGLHRLPPGIDLVVGIPRSGMIAATCTALLCNLELADLDGYLEGRTLNTGRTKRAGMPEKSAGPRKVLVIDDSINSGKSMADARQRVAEAGLTDEVVFAAVYGSKPSHPQADIVFEIVPWPRMFQWNFMHHKLLADCCIDIDGVLCHDPLHEQNDDGEEYVKFLMEARPLYAFSVPLGRLVTSRLEKYRPQTEAWLAERRIVYRELIMLDLPSAAERRKRGVHGSFKAGVFRNSDAPLFIESENRQAEQIALMSGKPVLCLQTHRIIYPGREDRKSDHRLIDRVPRSARETVKWTARHLLSPSVFDRLRARVRR
jgi:uncharacterized HAD superfamily protein/adenine/guanine phosphoribosyltransferase-like PRPP-binding protein